MYLWKTNKDRRERNIGEWNRGTKDEGQRNGEIDEQKRGIEEREAHKHGRWQVFRGQKKDKWMNRG